MTLFTGPVDSGVTSATFRTRPNRFIVAGILASLLISMTTCTDRSGHSAATRSEPEDTLGARYERTAIALGCMSFRRGDDETLRIDADQLLKSMGFTLETYVQASLSLSDPEMSERIFTAILACGRRAGEGFEATPPSAP